MRFHHSKCKVLMVFKINPPLINILPFVQFYYTKNKKIPDYFNTEKDLGVTINRTLNLLSMQISFTAKPTNV